MVIKLLINSENVEEALYSAIPTIQSRFNPSCKNKQVYPSRYYVNLLSSLISDQSIFLPTRRFEIYFFMIYYQ